MPSGLTDKIGKGASFVEFALGCARQFGGLVHMRDEPSGSKITLPTKRRFSDDSYYQEQLDKSIKELNILENIDMDMYTEKKRVEREEQVKYYENVIKEQTELKVKYEAMLEKVNAWLPPSDEHEGLKNYMIKQIEDSIDWDCKVEFYEEAKAKYEGPFDAEEFLKKDISKVKENIEYYEREMNSDKEREDNRGEWVIDLVNSLNMSTEEKEELLDFDV